jgi:choline dehydrogenase
LGIFRGDGSPGVGQNSQDHFTVAVACACIKAVTMADAGTVGNTVRYLLCHQGPLTSNIAEAGGFIKTNLDVPAPALQLFFALAYYLNHGFWRPERHGFMVMAALLRPQSRGRSTLAFSDPFDQLVIDPAYLRESADLQTLLEGFRLCRRLVGIHGSLRAISGCGDLTQCSGAQRCSGRRRHPQHR